MYFDEKFWIALAFFIFVTLLYKKLSQKFLLSLDNKSKEIEEQLNEAAKLKKEAQKIKIAYLAREKEAKKQAKEIILNAERSAEKVMAEAQRKIAQNTAHKLAQIEDNIANIEKQALAEIKIDAVQSALEQFNKELKDNIDQDRLVAKTINSFKQSN
jgi:F-type H+-transporting ATPase subunit b